MGGAEEPAGGASGWSGCGRASTRPTRASSPSTARGLARALLGDAALGAVPRQQAPRRLRRAPRPRSPRQLRRHPPDPDPGDVPAVLRADARRLGHRRGALGGGDELVRAARAHADLHPDLAAHPHVFHPRASASSSSRAGCGRASRAWTRACWRSRPGDADEPDARRRRRRRPRVRRLAPPPAARLPPAVPVVDAGRGAAADVAVGPGADRAPAHRARARRRGPHSTISACWAC